MRLPLMCALATSLAFATSCSRDAEAPPAADPAAATAEMGRVFLDYKISDAIEQIRTALAKK